MGRKKGTPTGVIPIRVNLNIKKLVKSYARIKGISNQSAYKILLKSGRIK